MRAEALQDLYNSEINFSITTLWDGGFDVALGDEINGYNDESCCDTLEEAIEFLIDAAVQRYPASDFTVKYRK